MNKEFRSSAREVVTDKGHFRYTYSVEPESFVTDNGIPLFLSVSTLYF